MASKNWVNIGLVNGLMPDTKSEPDPLFCQSDTDKEDLWWNFIQNAKLFIKKSKLECCLQNVTFDICNQLH